MQVVMEGGTGPCTIFVDRDGVDQSPRSLAPECQLLCVPSRPSPPPRRQHPEAVDTTVPRIDQEGRLRDGAHESHLQAHPHNPDERHSCPLGCWCGFDPLRHPMPLRKPDSRTDKPSRRVCLIIRGGVLTSLAGMGRSGTRMLGMVRKFKAASFGEACSRLAGSASAARGACGPAPRVVAPAAKEGGSGGVGGCSRRRAGGSSGGGAAGMLLAVSAMSLTGQASCFSMHAAARHGPLILRPVQHAGSTRSPLRLPGTVPRAALARATIILAPHTEFPPKIRSHLAS
jgi:hypothetical protein